MRTRWRWLCASLAVLGLGCTEQDTGPQNLNGVISTGSAASQSYVRFSINGGQTTVTNVQCTLTVDDSAHALVSARFTQAALDSVDSAGTTRMAGPGDSTVFANDTYGQLGGLVRANWNGLQTPHTVATHRYVPLFDASDSLNSTRAMNMAGAARATLLWRLKGGIKGKRVWAEVTYAGGRVDTLVAVVNARSRGVKVALVSETEAVFGREEDGNDSVDIVTTFGDEMRFTVDVSGDAWVGDTFDCWLVTATEYERVSGSYLARGWVMTRPMSMRLTAPGGAHDRSHVYTLTIDTMLAEGRAALDMPIKGRGTTISGPVTSVASARRIVDSLKAEPKWRRGAKQMVLAVRLRDRGFDDSFVQVIGWQGAQEQLRTYRDVYGPLVRLNPRRELSAGFLSNGSVVSAPFDVVLDTLSLVDGGGESIDSVRLVVARKPQGLQWSAGAAAGITLETLARTTVGSFALVPSQPSERLRGLRWDGIDPAGWQAGEYLMAIVAHTRVAGERLCTIANPSAYGDSNPWLVVHQE